MTAEFINALTEIVGAGAIKFDEPMKLHTTFQIGGPADVFVTPADAGSLQRAVECCRTFHIPWMIIGNGSNLLVSDKGIRGVVFQIYQTMDQIRFEPCGEDETLVIAGAGILLSRLSRAVAREGLGGFEFASGIPGTFGGAVTMNAGAYGGEMQPLIDSVTVLTADGQLRTLKQEEMAFGYRTSIVQKEKMIVLEAVLRLKKDDPAQIMARITELGARRREKQPLEYPSAGSTFKRPEGYFAGKLIEDCGLKGFCVGNAQVSEKHSGFVINTGGATAADVLGLIRHIQSVVYERFGVKIEPEVRIIGEFVREVDKDAFCDCNWNEWRR